MKKLGLWWVPLLLVLAPLFGKMPLARDIPGYFVPMRATTSARMASGQVPWLNDQNGCGEAWFADPETGVLYPLHWIYLVLPIDWGMSLEVGIHLALLALGMGLLAKKLGAGSLGRMATEVVAWSAGPIVTVAGMTNNLDTLAWTPWMVLAALRKDRLSLPLLALATAMAWLAGEPEVWAVAVAMTIIAAPRRARALAGVGLGVLLVAVQLVPFVFWILEGDRGSGTTLPYLYGAVAPAGWLKLLVPGLPAFGEGTYFVASLFVGAPVLVCLWLGLKRRWIWAVPAAALAILATLPAAGGARIYLFVTRALVRYPSRFAVMAFVTIVPFVGAGAGRWLDGEGKIAGGLLGAAAVAAGISSKGPWAVVTGVVTGAAILVTVAMPYRRWLRSAVLGIGIVACVGASWPLLHVGRPVAVASEWTGTAGAGRLYTPPPPAGSIWWLSRPEHGAGLWPLGYINLVSGIDLVRTYAPVTNARLATHLKRADAGPRGFWWLTTLGARWLVLGTRIEVDGLEPVTVKKGLWLYKNRRALPEASVWGTAPVPETMNLAPAIVTIARPRPEHLIVSITSARAGQIVLSETPVHGWHWKVDGQPAAPQPGPGILQSFGVASGSHVLEGIYRPPGLIPAGAVSVLALLLSIGWFVPGVFGPRHAQDQTRERAASR